MTTAFSMVEVKLQGLEKSCNVNELQASGK